MQPNNLTRQFAVSIVTRRKSLSFPVQPKEYDHAPNRIGTAYANSNELDDDWIVTLGPMLHFEIGGSKSWTFALEASYWDDHFIQRVTNRHFNRRCIQRPLH